MKRIEAMVQSGVAKRVVDAVRLHGVGVTLVEALGRGDGERPWIGGEGGHRIEFNSTAVIVTVVDDADADAVVSSILDAAHTGSPGDGMVFVTGVEGAYNITTRSRI